MRVAPVSKPEGPHNVGQPRQSQGQPPATSHRAAAQGISTRRNPPAKASSNWGKPISAVFFLGPKKKKKKGRKFLYAASAGKVRQAPSSRQPPAFSAAALHQQGQQQAEHSKNGGAGHNSPDHWRGSVLVRPNQGRCAGPRRSFGDTAGTADGEGRQDHQPPNGRRRSPRAAARGTSRPGINRMRRPLGFCSAAGRPNPAGWRGCAMAAVRWRGQGPFEPATV